MRKGEEAEMRCSERRGERGWVGDEGGEVRRGRSREE